MSTVAYLLEQTAAIPPFGNLLPEFVAWRWGIRTGLGGFHQTRLGSDVLNTPTQRLCLSDEEWLFVLLFLATTPPFSLGNHPLSTQSTWFCVGDSSLQLQRWDQG